MVPDWMALVCALPIFLFRCRALASPVSQRDRLAYQASMDQSVEKHKDTSINISIQISISSDSQHLNDRAQIQNVKEDIVHVNSQKWREYLMQFVNEMNGIDGPSSSFQDNDQNKCNVLQGKCQDDSLQCTGSYFSGKCSGPHNIKCCTNNITLQDTKTCRNVPIFSRDSWGARRPIKIEKLSLPVGMFFIHHTATPTCTSADTCAALLRSIQRFHMDTRKWDDIAYSFLVGQDGRVYEGRGWDRVGSQTHDYNECSLAVSVMGNFMGVVPNSAALKAVQDLLACGAAEGYMTSRYSLYGHRDVRDTECPGDAFYNLIRTWPHYNTTTDKDGGCLAKHGVCKPNYLPCSGQYEKGLCNGYYRRQCCVP